MFFEVRERNFLIIGILTIIFLVNFIPHQMPYHIDSWQVVSKADFVVKEKELTFEEPFSNTNVNYPPGSHLHLSVLNSISNLNLILLQRIISGILLVTLGLMFYLISKELFNKKIALTILAFTPLALSNITMLGPFYLVPFTWGMILALFTFYLIIKERWLTSIFIFLTLTLTHRSSTIFTIIGLTLFLIFNKKYWSKIKYFSILGIIAVITSFATFGINTIIYYLKSFFTSVKIEPYIDFFRTIPLIFFILFIIGYYLILEKEKKASKFLIPLMSILIINFLLYSIWKGVLLVYRRSLALMFLMTPFFIGYAIYKFSEFLGKKFKVKVSTLIIIFIVILLPLAIKTNYESHKSSDIYVSNAEHNLFTEFGRQYPGSHLATDHLQAFALPYYNLKPLQLSPAHGTSTLYYSELGKCFGKRSAQCLGYFFNKTNYSLVYVGDKMESLYFDPYFTSNNKTIYQFNRENFIKQEEKLNNDD
jgi:hypothetical protein